MKLARLPVTALLLGTMTFGHAAPRSVAFYVQPIAPNEHKILMKTTVQSPRGPLWNALTDFDHHARILPYMTKSQVLERHATSYLVEQEGKIRILFWTFTMCVKQNIFENPPQEISFHAIEGDFQKLEGVWSLTPIDNHTTTLECQFVVQPKAKVPTWAVRMAAKHYLATMVKSLAREAESHAAR